MRKKSLILRNDHIGDLILTTPLIRTLSQSTEYNVDVVTKKSNLQLLVSSPYVSELFAIEDIAPDFPRHWQTMARWIREQKYDLLILPFAKPRTVLIASFFSGVKKRIVMTGGIWGRLTLHKCLKSRLLYEPRHMAEVILDFARELHVPIKDSQPEIFLTNEEKLWAKQEIYNHFKSRNVIGIHPGCAGNTCNLPAAVYGDIADLILKKTDYGIIVTGNNEEKTLLKDWSANVTQSERCWFTHGSFTLRQLTAIIAEVDVILCPSTGPLQIASAMRTVSISPMCPVSNRGKIVWGNRDNKSIVLEGNIINCKIIKEGYTEICDFQGYISAEKIYSKIQNAFGRHKYDTL
jgi:ADP-heptose:LPS heptosyltransferase